MRKNEHEFRLDRERTKDATNRKKYDTPELIRHGMVHELTQGLGTGDADVGYGSVPW